MIIMKKRNLFLSILCSVVLVFLLVGFTIVDVMGKKPDNNNADDPATNVNDPNTPSDPTSVDPVINEGENKGTEEDPYYIYDAETFINLISEYGSKTLTVTVPSEAEETIDEYAEEGEETAVEVTTYETVYHFVLLNDIDFSGVDYVTLFNLNDAFIGVLDGAGYSLKNISINVNADNYLDYSYSYTNESGYNYINMRVGIFGNLNGATISNLKVENMNVTIADEVYENVGSNSIIIDGVSYTVKEVNVGTVAAYAIDTTLDNVTLTATIDADGYAVSSNGAIGGSASLGGLIGETNNVKISNSNVNVTILAGSGNRNYYLGGLVGRLYTSTIENTNVTANVEAVSAPNAYRDLDRTYIAGVAGFARNVNLSNMVVNLNVTQVEEARQNLSGITSINLDKYNLVAGIFVTVRADSDADTTTITGVTVHSNVQMDAAFAGAIFTVDNADYANNNTVDANNVYYIYINDTILDSEVSTIKAYGIGANLLYTKVSYQEDFAYARYTKANGAEVEYAVKLTGEVTLVKTDKLLVTAIVAGNEANNKTGVDWTVNSVQMNNGTIDCDITTLKVVVSNEILNQATNISNLWNNQYSNIVVA